MKKELRKRLIQTKKKKKSSGEKFKKKNLPEIEVIEKKKKRKETRISELQKTGIKKTSFL